MQLAPGSTVGVKHVEDGSIAYGVPAVTASEVIVRETAWLFVSVTLMIALVCPTTTPPKAIEAGERVVGAMPVPLSGTVSGLLLAVSVIVRLPDFTPNEAGVSVIAIEQPVPPANVPELGHVVDGSRANPVPVTPREVIVMADDW